ncbi:hypothetical protein WJX72_002702 [[Myrmecia] bisecta]|uniref:Uncharacterized protein n=1 Tax=[Myrmecia] bisecta TaxID=41462 RepID=A0AAW1R5U7_9CHLO
MNPAATPGTATQTPARPPKAAQGSTWEADLKLYLEGQGATPPSVRSQRNSLVGALHADLKSPTAWLSFLEHEEAVLSGSTNTLDGAFRTNRQGVTLFHLYSWATKVVERHGNYQNIAYLRLWLGFARQQWFKSEDDARDTFKMLKGQHIGDTFAALYADWATLEHSTGNLSKSLSIVEKGIRAGAAPVSSLESMLAQLKNGTFTSRAPGQPGITTGLTSHSGAAHCGDGSHTANMEDTLELTRCKVPGSHEPSAKPPTDTILIHKAAAGALSRGNHTSFSITSSSASEETHTLHSHARMATPATGLTTRSTSSHGSSGDEETVALGIRNTSANKAGGDEPTIIVNRSLSGASQAAKAASYSFASAFRGPKRTGLGGGAMRVRRSTDSDPSSQSAAEGGDESPSDASKKRKADKDAHQSPQPVTSVPGGTKRRQSPEVEVKTMASLAATAESRPHDEEIEDTVPIVNSRLAARALHGRQSIAPGAFKKGSPEEVYVRKVVSEADAPTQPLSKPTAPVAAPVQEDADSTLPLSRPPAASRPITPNAAGQKQVRLETPGSNAVKALSRPTPPAPPSQHYIARPTPPAPPAAEKPAPAVAPRPIMGPPAPVSAANRPRQPLAPVLQPAAPQMQAPPPQPMSAQIQQHQAQVQQQRQRRVREDENTVMVRATRYTKLECVGRGGSSKVFKVMAPNRKIYALKRIKLQGRDAEAASGFIDEITLLQRLRNKQNIIQLVDAEVIQAEGLIYMVLEYGDIDLARLLAKHEKARGEGRPGEVDENFVRLYWQQMLQAVDTIHEARIVHSDLKPANFLMVEGQLKLIDFGIAKAIQSDTTSIARESQVGTLNYMSPEAILGGNNNIRGGPPMKVGRPSDIWSLGCILYQMVYGHTPFSAYPFIQKMHAITDPTHRVDFPPLKNAALLDAMRRCLDRNPRTRITMQELLDHPFLWPEKAANPQGLVGLSRDQLRKLLSHPAQASSSCAAGGVSVAAAAAAAALRRTTQGGAGSGSAAAPVRPLSSIGNLQSEILQKAASLKRVEPASKPAPHPDQENHLAAALRKGLEKFHFDDSTLHGEDSNTTSGFSV